MKFLQTMNSIKNAMEEKSIMLQMNELKEKSIIDLSLLSYYQQEGEYKKEADAYIKVIKNIISEKFKNLPEFYFLLEVSTDFPLITKDDEILVFTEKGYATNAKREYKKYNKNVIVCTIVNEEFDQFFYHMFCCNGIKGLRMNEGICVYKLESSYLYKETDMISFIKNPAFVLALYKLVQEHNWKIDYEEKEDVYNKLLTNMTEEIQKAKFIQLINNDEKTFIKKKKKQAIPLFTDEIQKNMIAEGISAKVIPFEELDITKTYIINPKDVCFELNKDIFEMIAVRASYNQQDKI